MTKEFLAELQRNIQKNWNSGVKPFDTVRKEKVNCYMFAIGCTKPTEIYAGEVKGIPVSLSMIGEYDKTYFGTIGQFSNKTEYTSIDEVEDSFISDLGVLGLKCVKCELDAKVPKRSRKIAFFYDTNALKAGRIAQFHFLRFDNQYWYHKLNWTTEYARLPRKNRLEAPNEVKGMEFVGSYLINVSR